jgi:sugar-specific transcriptional regulator TrmB
MTKIASALGGKYQENRLSVMTRTFVLGDHTFKVRVPAVHEIETIFNYFKNPDEALVEKAFKELTYELINIKDTNPKGVVYSENDVVVESRSMREAAKNKVILQYRIVEYFKFLIPEDGQTLSDLEYSDIEEEFPLSIQIQLVDKISEVISPDYKAIKEK